MRSFFVYRSPTLAIAALAALVLVLIINILPMDHVDKFGFLLAMGLAVYFLVVAGKAGKRNHSQNLAGLLFVVALAMILIGVVFTSKEVLAASALEDLTNPIIGGIGGFFSGVEED